MNNNGICMRKNGAGEVIQLLDNISFGEAFLKVSELRSKNDDNWYWIGHAANHKLLS